MDIPFILRIYTVKFTEKANQPAAECKQHPSESTASLNTFPYPFEIMCDSGAEVP